MINPLPGALSKTSAPEPLSTTVEAFQTHTAAAPYAMLSADELTEAAVGAAPMPLSAERAPPTVNSAAAAVVMHSAEDAIEAVAAAPQPKSEQAAVAIPAAAAGTDAVPPSDSWAIAFSIIGQQHGQLGSRFMGDCVITHRLQHGQLGSRALVEPTLVRHAHRRQLGCAMNTLQCTPQP